MVDQQAAQYTLTTQEVITEAQVLSDLHFLLPEAVEEVVETSVDLILLTTQLVQVVLGTTVVEVLLGTVVSVQVLHKAVTLVVRVTTMPHTIAQVLVPEQVVTVETVTGTPTEVTAVSDSLFGAPHMAAVVAVVRIELQAPEVVMVDQVVAATVVHNQRVVMAVPTLEVAVVVPDHKAVTLTTGLSRRAVTVDQAS